MPSLADVLEGQAGVSLLSAEVRLGRIMVITGYTSKYSQIGLDTSLVIPRDWEFQRQTKEPLFLCMKFLKISIWLKIIFVSF